MQQDPPPAFIKTRRQTEPHQRQACKHRQQDDHRKLCQQRQTARQSEQQNISRRPGLQINPEHEKKEQKGERGSQIGMDDAPVGQHRRLQREQSDGNHTGARSEKCAGTGEDKDAESNREDDHHRPGPEQDALELGLIVLPEAVFVTPCQ